MLIHLPITKLTANASNPRSITREAFERLCQSLTEDPDFLEARPILVLQEGEINTIYAGTQRYRAARKLGWKEVPCHVETGLDPEVIKKRIIKDNLHDGEWDFDILSSDYELEELLNLGLDEKLLGLDCEEKETSNKAKLKAIIQFEDTEQMNNHTDFLEEYCEKHNLKIEFK